MRYELVSFDLDGTLTPSKGAMTPQMGAVLASLCQATRVCVISGGTFAQFRRQLLDHVQLSDAAAANLHLMPTCGTRYLHYREGEWQMRYEHLITSERRQAARAALTECARQLGMWERQTWGEVIEDRGSQITFSALGQQAPEGPKAAWDPDGAKRARLARLVQQRLPDLTVRSGGATSVDVTLKGVDKAYGMRQLLDHLGISAYATVFFGDRLDEDGNDYPVRATGIECRPVSDWRDTASQIRQLLQD